jgi:hypothetical protein
MTENEPFSSVVQPVARPYSYSVAVCNNTKEAEHKLYFLLI